MLSELELDRLRSDGALLLTLIGKTVKLKRKGKVHTGLCPFHMEDTPSFSVYADGHYHCFGCAAHGTVIDWVMHEQHLDFVKACEFLLPATPTDSKGTKPVKARANGNGNGRHRDVPFGERPFGEPVTPVTTVTTDEWHPIMPVPSDAPAPK